MSDKNFDVSSTIYFIFCILFVVTGVWFPLRSCGLCGPSSPMSLWLQ